MTLTQATKTCFRKYVTFSGRARRPEFWYFVLFLFLASIVVSIIDGLIFGPSTTASVTQTTGTDGGAMTSQHMSREYGNGPLSSLFSLATILPVVAVTWRRLHDTGRPGWYALIPLLISFSMIIFMFTGIFGVGMMENAGISQDALRGPAAAIGVSGMIVAVIAQLVVTILLIWWLTRPTQPHDNAYGPEPQ